MSTVTLVLRRVYNDLDTDQLITEDVDYDHDVTTGTSADDLLAICRDWLDALDDIPAGSYYVEAREALGAGSGELLAESDVIDFARP